MPCAERVVCSLCKLKSSDVVCRATISGMVSTPAVRQATRDHFNCPDAKGALLEQDGGDATSGSHWESTIFQSEIMIGASAAVERRVLSPVTLGLAQDSGWYVPNWESQGFLRHGHLVGCDMLVRPLSPPAHCCCAELKCSEVVCFVWDGSVIAAGDVR